MPASSFETVIDRCAILWEGDKITGFRLPSPQTGPGAEAPGWIQPIIQSAREHLKGHLQSFAGLPYAWEQVGDFQRRVYQAALAVQPGDVWSYGRLTKAIGEGPGVARAVGSALGQNPWPLLVPCHRFVGADGRMTGFSSPGGITTKVRLLQIEGAELFAE